MTRRSSQIGFRRAAWFVARALASQRSLIFRPARDERGTPGDYGMSFETRHLPTPSGTVRAWWVRPRDGRATAILLPGRGVNISYELEVIRYLWQLDIATLAVDYPGFGVSEGKPSEQGCYAAAAAAWQAIGDRSGRAQKVFLYGRSLGAAVAAWLAARVKSDGLILHGGFPSLPQAARSHLPGWGVRLLCRTDLDTERWAAQRSCPLLVMHAAEDRLVPLGLGQKLFERAPAPKRMITVAGGHFDADWLSSGEVRDAWQELLSGAAERWGEGR